MRCPAWGVHSSRGALFTSRARIDAAPKAQLITGSKGQAMAITNTEFLKDRMRVHYCCKRPWGTPDEDALLDVTYESLPTLPPSPSLDHGPGGPRETWEELVYIPTEKLTVSFHFAQWQETDDCRMQAFVGGPYLWRAAG